MLPPIEIKLTEDPASVVAILARQISEVCGLEMPITEHEMQIFIIQACWEAESRDRHPSNQRHLHLILDED